MDISNLTDSQRAHVCELCKQHDPTVKDYTEDFALQTALGDYVEKLSGDKINAADITRLCDSCYSKMNIPEDEAEEDNGEDS